MTVWQPVLEFRGSTNTKPNFEMQWLFKKIKSPPFGLIQKTGLCGCASYENPELHIWFHYLWFRKNTIASTGWFQPDCQPGASPNWFTRQENQNYLLMRWRLPMSWWNMRQYGMASFGNFGVYGFLANRRITLIASRLSVSPSSSR